MGFKDYGLEFGNPDFVQYAKSYGATGSRVDKADQLLTIMKKCLEAGGVHLIDIPIDYSENETILTHDMRERTCDL